MQVNSQNNVTFGCGACAAAYKNALKLKKVPGTVQNRIRNKKLITQATKDMIIRLKEQFNITHGQAASKYNEYLKKTLKDPSRVEEIFKS